MQSPKAQQKEENSLCTKVKQMKFNSSTMRTYLVNSSDINKNIDQMDDNYF